MFLRFCLLVILVRDTLTTLPEQCDEVIHNFPGFSCKNNNDEPIASGSQRIIFAVTKQGKDFALKVQNDSPEQAKKRQEGS